ncbi:MAG: (deoxy)nucleoside triphosphate pyrophosphohydrolase [Planctomycetaceae bacterium]
MSTAPSRTLKTIGIAIVEYADQFLVGIRPPGVDLAGCSEFPGGKCLPGESPRACAERECLEETGLTVRGIELLLNRRFEYPHGTFDLHFWRCAPVDASQLAEEHQGFEWVPRHELSSRTFPEGNLPVVRLLMGGGLPTAGAA